MQKLEKYTPLRECDADHCLFSRCHSPLRSEITRYALNNVFLYQSIPSEFVYVVTSFVSLVDLAFLVRLVCTHPSIRFVRVVCFQKISFNARDLKAVFPSCIEFPCFFLPPEIEARCERIHSFCSILSSYVQMEMVLIGDPSAPGAPELVRGAHCCMAVDTIDDGTPRYVFAQQAWMSQTIERPGAFMLHAFSKPSWEDCAVFSCGVTRGATEPPSIFQTTATNHVASLDNVFMVQSEYPAMLTIFVELYSAPDFTLLQLIWIWFRVCTLLASIKRKRLFHIKKALSILFRTHNHKEFDSLEEAFAAWGDDMSHNSTNHGSCI